MNNYLNEFEDEMLLLEGENGYEVIQKLATLIDNKIASIGKHSLT
jgi:hypothetical protein